MFTYFQELVGSILIELEDQCYWLSFLVVNIKTKTNLNKTTNLLGFVATGNHQETIQKTSLSLKYRKKHLTHLISKRK